MNSYNLLRRGLASRLPIPSIVCKRTIVVGGAPELEEKWEKDYQKRKRKGIAEGEKEVEAREEIQPEDGPTPVDSQAAAASESRTEDPQGSRERQQHQTEQGKK
ncbi:uncharacterized protein VTP21DRAFT_10590 [Calcarisporiella thermophila]|uniref:uncharacterized protein n=1 Tax=Calcarisporiella thermophila TaxID=911321 RepID=UPI0037429B10